MAIPIGPTPHNIVAPSSRAVAMNVDAWNSVSKLMHASFTRAAINAMT